MFLRKTAYEGNIVEHPNFGGSPRPAADPNDAEEGMDQHGESPP